MKTTARTPRRFGWSSPVLFAAALLACSGPTRTARAEVVESYIPVRVTGISLFYIGLGTTDADGHFVSYAGNQIVSSTLSIDYRPAPGEDINNLFIGMQVPTDAANSVFSVEGTLFNEISPGLFHYDLTTDLFNGTVQEGGFDVITGSFVDGEQLFTTGQYSATSGFYYSVDVVPEPSTCMMIVLGAAGAGLVMLRRHQGAV